MGENGGGLIVGLSNLEEVELIKCRFFHHQQSSSSSSSSPYPLTIATNLPKLSNVKVNECKNIPESFFRILSQQRNSIQELQLIECSMECSDWMKYVSPLRHLLLLECSGSVENWKTEVSPFLSRATFTGLRELIIKHTSHSVDNNDLASIASKFPQLRKLDLETTAGKEWTADGILVYLTKLKYLNELNLTQNGFGVYSLTRKIMDRIDRAFNHKTDLLLNFDEEDDDDDDGYGYNNDSENDDDDDSEEYDEDDDFY